MCSHLPQPASVMAEMIDRHPPLGVFMTLTTPPSGGQGPLVYDFNPPLHLLCA